MRKDQVYRLTGRKIKVKERKPAKPLPDEVVFPTPNDFLKRDKPRLRNKVVKQFYNCE